jgi:hypothetical protein
MIIITNKSSKLMKVIHLNHQTMTSNLCLAADILVNAIASAASVAIAIGLITCNAVSPATAQTNPPEPSQPNAELTQAPSYIGVGCVIGLQGGTTSLSQGTFSILTKQVLTENLAIHNANTIFGSLTPSASIALTYNQPMSGEGIPIVFTPFVGAGIMTHYDNGMSISPHLTGGVDVSTPLLNLTGTLRINAGFVSDRQADLGVLFGIGFSR